MWLPVSPRKTAGVVGGYLYKEYCRWLPTRNTAGGYLGRYGTYQEYCRWLPIRNTAGDYQPGIPQVITYLPGIPPQVVT